MAGFFSRLKGKDGPAKISKSKRGAPQVVNDIPQKPRWEDAWTRKTVDPEEVQELLRGCTLELKSRGMFSRLFFCVRMAKKDMIAREGIDYARFLDGGFFWGCYTG